ncbi:MAG: FixH family protein [Candidatus Margulisbacteria bacterium]|jgi:hypothetical protein|nr:FixH family protein [Candidatus Margulisiibacteriota bacterium]
MQKVFWVLVLFLGICIYGYAQGEASPLKEKEKIKINDRYAFQYEFAQKPKMGPAVLKITVFDAALGRTDNKTTGLTILGSYDMPSMRGHHASGLQTIKTNKNKEYLFPVNFVMRGGWEIVLSFQDQDAELYSGLILVKI